MDSFKPGLWISWGICILMAVICLVTRSPADAYIAGVMVLSGMMYLEYEYLKNKS